MRLNVCNSLSVASIAALAALALYLYPDLPHRVPAHWNLAGNLDGTLSKRNAVLAALAAPLVTFVLLTILQRVSPRGFRMDQFQHVADAIVLTVTATLSGVGAIVLLSAGGNEVPRKVLLPLLLGAMFVVLGNYLGKVRRNFFIGIRTPWTLASDEVWLRTHRVGAWLFVLAGIAIMVSAAAPPRLFLLVLLWAIGAAAVVSVAYSFIVYRRLHGFHDRPG